MRIVRTSWIGKITNDQVLIMSWNKEVFKDKTGEDCNGKGCKIKYCFSHKINVINTAEIIR